MALEQAPPELAGRHCRVQSGVNWRWCTTPDNGQNGRTGSAYGRIHNLGRGKFRERADGKNGLTNRIKSLWFKQGITTSSNLVICMVLSVILLFIDRASKSSNK